MYNWTTTEMSRLGRRQLLRDVRGYRVAADGMGDLKRRSPIPSAAGWELVRQLGRVRKLLRPLHARG